MTKFKWEVFKNTDFYQVWRQTREQEPGEPMHSGLRESKGSFDTREEAEKYADELNAQEGNN